MPNPNENRDLPYLSQARGILRSASNLPGRIRHLFEAETFTMALSMAAILMGASLPRTWAGFKQPGAKAA
jgi:hypothetical protein